MVLTFQNVDVKIQVHFVSEFWRWRFEKYAFLMEHHKYSNVFLFILTT